MYDILNFIPDFYNLFTTLLDQSRCDFQPSTGVPSLTSPTGLPVFLLQLNWYTEYSFYEATNLLLHMSFSVLPYPYITKYLLLLQTQSNTSSLIWICRYLPPDIFFSSGMVEHIIIFSCVFSSLLFIINYIYVLSLSVHIGSLMRHSVPFPLRNI